MPLSVCSFSSSPIPSPLSSFNDASPPASMKYDLSNHSRTQAAPVTFLVGSTNTSSNSSIASIGRLVRNELQALMINTNTNTNFLQCIHSINTTTEEPIREVPRTDHIDHESLVNWIDQGDFESPLIFPFELEHTNTAQRIRADIGESLKKNFSSVLHDKIIVAHINLPKALEQTELLLRNFAAVPATGQHMTTRHSRNTEGKTLIEQAKQANAKDSHALLQRLDSPISPISPRRTNEGLLTKGRFTLIKGDHE